MIVAAEQCGKFASDPLLAVGPERLAGPRGSDLLRRTLLVALRQEEPRQCPRAPPAGESGWWLAKCAAIAPGEPLL